MMAASNIAADISQASRVKPVIGSKWKTTEPVRATKESFLDLLEGRTPLLHEAGFVSQENCSKLTNALEPRLTPYLHATGPKLAKVGIAQFEFQAQSEDDLKNRSGNGAYSHDQTLKSLFRGETRRSHNS